ncbi:MAG: hypothetical protein Q7S74_02705 [Nanoarchaeota archaeon]|nr:hypothetical protein [Nanoarchaeota archaeon]
MSNLNKKRKRNYKEISIEADKLIKQGARLEEIGIALNPDYRSPRGNALSYIKHSSQYDTWIGSKRVKEAKEENKREVLGEIVSILEGLVNKKAHEAGWAYERTIQYIRLTDSRRTLSRFDKYIELFNLYEKSTYEGIKIPLVELANTADLSAMCVSKILNRVGLSTLCNNKRGNKQTSTKYR